MFLTIKLNDLGFLQNEKIQLIFFSFFSLELTLWNSSDTPIGGGGGAGVLPIIAYTGRLHLKRVSFSGLGLRERVGISLFEVHERVGNVPFRSVKMS